MFGTLLWRDAARALLAASLCAAALACASQRALAQGTQPPADQSAPAQTAPTANPQDEPLYRDFKGVTLGMSAEEVRQKLGKPHEPGKDQDFFVFSDTQRARVFYDDKGKATGVVATYIGRSSGAPSPKAILGEELEAKADGSIYKLVQYPKAGYWIAYSRTAGDEPLTIVTMQRMPSVAP